MFTILETAIFSRLVTAILADDELMEFKVWLAGGPTGGDVIPGAQGLRKVRWSRQGMSKRGGARVVITTNWLTGESYC